MSTAGEKVTEKTASPPLINRDLSWLQFNERVLAEARSSANPLLERGKFLAITSSNLDEFFMIRLSSIDRSIAIAGRTRQKSKAASLEKVRAELTAAIKEFVAAQVTALDKLSEELRAYDIRILRSEHVRGDDRARGKAIFDEHVLPHCKAAEPFNLRKLYGLGSLQLAVVFPENIWCPIPKGIPAAYASVDPEKKQVLIFFLDHLLETHLGAAFGVKSAPGVLRLTRDGDVDLDLQEEDSESIPDLVRSEIRLREKGKPMRLQHVGAFADGFLAKATALLRVDPARVLPSPRTLCLHGLWPAFNSLPEAVRDRRELTYAPLKPWIPDALQPGGKPFASLRERDLLLHYPYDSFEGFVNFIRAACEDPKVESVQMTVYRIDTLSPTIGLLKEAAAKRKVRVIIELRARFDELNNLRMAEELRKAGVQVSFGFGQLKLHAKLALVGRREDGQLRYYTQLSTGNYHAGTARQYTDLSILTADPGIGRDAKLFFDAAARGRVPAGFKKLVSAPTRLHRRMVQHIEGETAAAKEGKPARIFAKVNALVDASIIDSLYVASQAGVNVDLIVRGACSLVPGVPGFSENIRVISIVDRFLEHSRIYFFEHSRAMYLSSADWMPRNFFSRLELAYPVLDPKIFEFIEKTVIPTYLADNVKARELGSDGNWTLRVPAAGQPTVRSQFVFQELAERER